MECSPRLERADSLVILAFEEEVDLWFCGLVTCPFCIFEIGSRLWRRGEAGQCG
jgi:hypothetical protein